MVKRYEFDRNSHKPNYLTVLFYCEQYYNVLVRSDTMKKLKEIIKEMVGTVNFDGLRCTIKGDSSIREIMGALKRQKEIDGGKE